MVSRLAFRFRDSPSLAYPCRSPHACSCRCCALLLLPCSIPCSCRSPQFFPALCPSCTIPLRTAAPVDPGLVTPPLLAISPGVLRRPSPLFELDRQGTCRPPPHFSAHPRLPICTPVIWFIRSDLVRWLFVTHLCSLDMRSMAISVHQAPAIEGQSWAGASSCLSIKRLPCMPGLACAAPPPSDSTSLSRRAGPQPAAGPGPG